MLIESKKNCSLENILFILNEIQPNNSKFLSFCLNCTYTVPLFEPAESSRVQRFSMVYYLMKFPLQCFS